MIRETHGNDDAMLVGANTIGTESRMTAIEAGAGVVAQITDAIGLFAVVDCTTDVAGYETEVVRGNLGVRLTW